MKTRFLFICIGLSMLLFSCKTTAPTVGVLSGNLAPDITASNASGTSISLSQSKGKLILVEFWDVNNIIARKNHFEIQRMYSKYSTTEFKAGKGFEVYSLSIDADRAAWLSAVAKDGILWPIVVNDPKSWNAQAVLDYKIASLPKYFLVDENGVIINHNIIISDLDKILESLKD